MSDPIGVGAGWSLSQSLDGALRRAKPKESLSRHLVGHRVALPAAEQGHESDRSPADTALGARAAQSGEAAWAHERVALIGRALDAEAQRLAADPQKAGRVAEHLAPLIEQAFAGALAEAPGEQARAIVDREQEPLETELLAERAVMSVAATQRAEREGRRAALADELAMLKTQPQRWAASHARRGRAIGDLPLDEKRKTALKGVTARAQANAVAEGLLQQDATWLLEDLDDPDFTAALGKDDAARWRSEAEAAVARRAERIAAESAERAQLAASDMRASLKRFKDKDDGPLPPREQVVAALGDEAVADAVLSATLKGRKHRYAIGAAALLASVDEGAWLDAAPDKETRTTRELAVATKRAAVAGNPGRWLMQHSATLKELAKEATDDPAKLPRLVDQYAALRSQVGGRSGEAEDGTNIRTKPNVGSATDTPLPDAVAADLVEQVLAGETPQARLDSLIETLDGAADGGSTDGGDRARADAIARQLETLGLPEGTATRWAQLSEQQTRRSARLGLLGGFAKQIAEEEKILSGEGEEPEIVGEEGDDTISLGDIETGAFADQHRFEQLRQQVQALVASGAISEETAQRFLADARLNGLASVELPAEAIEALASGDNAAIVDTLSGIADVVLGAAAKFAELEEEYGWLATATFYGVQALIGGPAKAIVGFLIDKGFEKILGDEVAEGMQAGIDVGSAILQKELGIDDKLTADRISSAGILLIATLAGGTGTALRLMRHVGRSVVERLRGGTGALADVPMFDNKPLTRRFLERAMAKKADETNLQYMDRLLSMPQFRHWSPDAKRELGGFFSTQILVAH